MAHTAKVTSPGNASTSAVLPLDPNVGGPVGVFCDVTGTATFTIEMTPDNVYDSTVTPRWYATGVAALTGATGDVSAVLTFPAVAARINQASGAGTVELKVVWQTKT